LDIDDRNAHINYAHQECAYQLMILEHVSQCVVVCSEVGWVGFCSGAGGCMDVCGEEGGRLAGRLAGSRDPPGGQKVRKSINLLIFAKFSENS